MTTETAQQVAGDIAALLRARNPLLWIVTREEGRAEGYVFEAAASAGYLARTWDVAVGVREIDGRVRDDIGSPDPLDTLNVIETRATNKNPGTQERCAWVMRDLAPWLSGPAGARTNRALRNLARSLPSAPRATAQAVIVLTTTAEVPEELAGHATVIEFPLPDREEIGRLLDATIENLPDDIRDAAAPNGTRDAAIDAAVGLSAEEANACYARSLVQFRRIDPATVAKEKRRVVARERVIEWSDPLPGGLDAVGGLDTLKSWLAARRSAYTPAARDYGLPAPKGCLLVGIPGCGKSLSAKAIATAWGVPLLRMDLGALKSKFVGESEQNLRKAFQVISAIGRCVVWLDEIEKSLAGATQGAADGGVSSDALGAILSWMQERQGEAFVIATANDVSTLPPELLRKGRFDEVFYIDLPTAAERLDIIAAALRAHGRTTSKVFSGNSEEGQRFLAATENFTGAEIAALVPDALFAGFADKAREITADDLIAAAGTVVPLASTAAEKIEALRTWAKGRARPATSTRATEATGERRSAGRLIDL